MRKVLSEIITEYCESTDGASYWDWKWKMARRASEEMVFKLGMTDERELTMWRWCGRAFQAFQTACARAERSEKACWVQRIANTTQYVSCSVWQEARWSWGDEQGAVMNILDCRAIEFRFHRGSSWDHLRILSMNDRWYLYSKKLLWWQCGVELEGISMEAESS